MTPQWITNFIDSLKGLLTVPPVIIDGNLYVWLAVMQAMQLGFGSDEASKFYEPSTIFHVRLGINCISAGLLALKMYRSTAYADQKAEKEKANP